MSWLRDHFHNFVYPAFVAAEKKSTEIGAPFHIPVSKHAPDRLPTELKKLWCLCKDHGIEWSYDVRAINHHGGNSKYRDTAKLHQRMLRNSLESAVAAMKRERCTRLLFPGRDIYMLVPVCARRGIPFLFVPELSRPVSGHPPVREFLERLGLDGGELLIDTGYEGTIPANLNKWFPEFNFKFRFISQNDKGDPRDKFHSRPSQLFPNRKNARNEALETEYLAKYWKSGTWDDTGIVQYLADKRSIQRAALLTSMLFRGIPFWKVSAPAKHQQPNVYSMGTGNMVLNQGVINATNIMTFSTAGTTTATTTFGGILLSPNQVGQLQQQLGVQPPPTPITAAQAAAALAAVPQAPPLPPAPPPPGAPIALLPPAPTTAVAV